MHCAINCPAATTATQRDLSPAAKLRMVVDAETLDEGETLADVQRRHGVGRTCMFEARQRVKEALKPRKPGPDPRQRELERLRRDNERLREHNAQLSAELGDAKDRLSRSVEVTTARLVSTALMLLLCPVSTRKAHQVLVVAFGERFAPADNTLASWLLKYGRLARKIMADSAAALLVRSIAADEISFHGKPILCAVEPRSLAIVALERAEDCTADTWEIIFDDFENLELVATDLGKGLIGAVDRSDAISQADMLHFGWLFPTVEARLDKNLEAALGWHAGLIEAIKRARGSEKQRLIALLPRAAELRAEAFRQCRNAAVVEAALLERLGFLERSSSLAETINSKLRPLQSIKKQVNQPYLNLFALQNNLTPIERSNKREGLSPYKMLGVHLEGDEDGLLGVLLCAARREGLLK